MKGKSESSNSQLLGRKRMRPQASRRQGDKNPRCGREDNGRPLNLQEVWDRPLNLRKEGLLFGTPGSKQGWS